MKHDKLSNDLKARFRVLYPGRRLLAIQLDGFTHSAIHDGGTRSSAVIRESFSHCMPEGRWSASAREMFKDVPNASYQNNAREIVFIMPDKR